MERKYAWHNYDEQTLQDVMSLGDSYRQFLDNGKTERECVIQSVEAAKKAGYVDLKDLIKSNTPIKRAIRFTILIWINLLRYLISVPMIWILV